MAHGVYRDRFGDELRVVWNGQPGDFSLCSTMTRQPDLYWPPPLKL